VRAALLYVRAGLTVVAARVLLRRRDTTEVLRRLTGETQATEGADASRMLVAVRRTGRLCGANCLARSVALTVLLHRAGERPALVLGCRRYDDGRWGAHAWVDANGRKFELVPAGAHEELAQLDAAHDWVVTRRR
jgi:hypothetical protein